MAYKKEWVADQMRAKIANGEWNIGDSVGDIFALAEQFGVSMGTVGAAERILVGEGLLSEIRAGHPTRVIAIPPRNGPNAKLLTNLRALHADLGAIIKTLETA